MKGGVGSTIAENATTVTGITRFCRKSSTMTFNRNSNSMRPTHYSNIDWPVLNAV